MTKLLAAIGGILMLVAYFIYNGQILFGDAKPSIAAWLVFGFLVILNTSSYLKMSGDWTMSVLPILGALANITTTIIVVVKGGAFGTLRSWDWLALSIGLLACLIWMAFKEASYANVIVMTAVIIGFIPIYTGFYYETVQESPLAWFVWTTSYAVGTWVVFRRWKEQPEKKNRLELVYPVVSGILHASVGVIASL